LRFPLRNSFLCQDFIFSEVTMIRRAVFVALAISVFTAFSFSAQGEEGHRVFRNLDEIARATGFTGWQNAWFSRPVKIAVLDNGFRGYAAEVGKSLPAATIYHPGPVAVETSSEEAHGLFMAQMIAGLLAQAPGLSYELHLYSAFGYSNLKAAIDDVITNHVDVVLYAQVWEYGGNGDGRGFINALVNRATENGVLWVNAAGNFATQTFQSHIVRQEDDWAELPAPNQAVRVRCEQSSSGQCQLRVVLNWNDFKDDVTEGTDKDLDLVLTDDTLQILQTGALSQRRNFPEGQPGLTLYPREIVQATVKPGVYFLRVKIRSQNFSDRDSLRLTVTGDSIRLLDATPGETLLPPADNPAVITIGASDSEKSSESLRARKPELWTSSLVVLENGESYKGTSNSAAIAAAAVALLKATRPDLNRETAIAALSRGGGRRYPQPDRPEQPGQSVGLGLPLEMLGFFPTGPQCFSLAILPYIPEALLPILRSGALTVGTTAGPKIFTAMDPFTLVPGVFRSRFDDMLMVGPNGYFVAPRFTQGQYGYQAFEVVQQPVGQAVCGLDGTPGASPLPPPWPGRNPQGPQNSAKPELRLPQPASF
jgi:hypothetical protein